MSATPPQSRAKLGRKSKGPRKMTPVYLPDELRELVEQTAENDGLPLTAVVTRFVAEKYGRTPPDYCQPRQRATAQEELPLQEVAEVTLKNAS